MSTPTVDGTSPSLPLHKKNPTLHNAAKRFGFARLMEHLEAKDNYEARLTLLYRLRCEGRKVLFQPPKIVVGGITFLAPDFDKPDEVRERLSRK